MQLLLDSHVLLWWLLDEPLISAPARSAMADDRNQILISAASVWEISIKYRSGKLPVAAHVVGTLDQVVLDEGFSPLSVNLYHGRAAGSLPLHHKDPFDRMLIAQALAESLTLVSNERLFDRYGVARLW